MWSEGLRGESTEIESLACWDTGSEVTLRHYLMGPLEMLQIWTLAGAQRCVARSCQCVRINSENKHYRST